MLYTKNDFRVIWFSGTGAGGQYRNKHQNSCRIIHIDTGLMGVGQMHRERSRNFRDAFHALAAKLIALGETEKERRHTHEVVRTYHFERGQCIDHSSGIVKSPQAVCDGDLDDFFMHPNRGNDRPNSGRA